MKVCFCADVHLANHRRFGMEPDSGLNRRARLVLDVLGAAVNAANARSADVFVVLGDLFDADRPSPPLIRAAQAKLEVFKGRVVVLRGNHDMTSDGEDDCAISPLRPVATVIERPTFVDLGENVYLAAVPYISGVGDEVLPEAINRAIPTRRVKGCKVAVAIHSGIRDELTPSFLEGCHDSISIDLLTGILEKRAVRHAFAGNWHERRDWIGDRSVHQVGALCPTGFDNLSVPGQDDPYGQLVFWDTASDTTTSVSIPGPRFYKVTNLIELEEIFKHGWLAGAPFYLLASVAPDHVGDAEKLIAEHTRPELAGFAVEVDRAAERKLAERAADVARGKETLTQALLGFVNEAPFERKVDRVEVLARARRYLKL